MRRLVQRLGFALAVVGVAVLCMWSPYLAGVIGLLTAATVAVDMFVFSRRQARQDQPEPPTVTTAPR